MIESSNQPSVPLIHISNAGSSGKMDKAKTLCRVFKNPPQPHMCIQDFLTDSPDPCFVNVLSWSKLSTPSNPKDPIPLYGGMKVLNHSTNALQLTISSYGQEKEFTKPPVTYAVMANPEVLKISGKKSADIRDRDAFIDLMLDFVEAMNPGIKFQRKFVVLGDRDLAGELKDIWYTVHNKRQQEKMSHASHGERDLSFLNGDSDNFADRFSKQTTKTIGDMSVKDVCLGVDNPERELFNVGCGKPDKWLCYNHFSEEENVPVEIPFCRDVGREEVLEGWNYEYDNNGALDIPMQPLFPLNFEPSVSSFSESEHISVTSFLEEEQMFLEENIFENCKPTNVLPAASSLEPLHSNYFSKSPISSFASTEILVPFEDEGDKHIALSHPVIDKNVQSPTNYCGVGDVTRGNTASELPVESSSINQVVNTRDLDIVINVDGKTDGHVEQRVSETANDQNRDDAIVINCSQKVIDTVKCKHISDSLKMVDLSSQESLDEDKENSSNENIGRPLTQLHKPLVRYDLDELEFDWQTIENSSPEDLGSNCKSKFSLHTNEDGKYSLVNSALSGVETADEDSLDSARNNEYLDFQNLNIKRVQENLSGSKVSEPLWTSCIVHTASSESANDSKFPNFDLETGMPISCFNAGCVLEEKQERDQTLVNCSQLLKEKQELDQNDSLAHLKTSKGVRSKIEGTNFPFGVQEKRNTDKNLSKNECVSSQNSSHETHKSWNTIQPKSSTSNTVETQNPVISQTSLISAAKCKPDRKNLIGNKIKSSKESLFTTVGKSDRPPNTPTVTSGKPMKQTRTQQIKPLPLDSTAIQRHATPLSVDTPLTNTTLRTRRHGAQNSSSNRSNSATTTNILQHSESPRDVNSRKIDRQKLSKSITKFPKPLDAAVFHVSEKHTKVKKDEEVDRRSKKRPSEKQPSDSLKNKSVLKQYSLDNGSTVFRRHDLHVSNTSTPARKSATPACKTSQNLETSKEVTESPNIFPVTDVTQNECDHSFETCMATSSPTLSWEPELPIQTQFAVEEINFVAFNDPPSLETCTAADYEMENNSLGPSLHTTNGRYVNDDVDFTTTSIPSEASELQDTDDDSQASDQWDISQRPRVTVEYLPILDPMSGLSDNSSKGKSVKKNCLGLEDTIHIKQNGPCEILVQVNNRPESKTENEFPVHKENVNLESTSGHLESLPAFNIQAANNSCETDPEVTFSSSDKDESQ